MRSFGKSTGKETQEKAKESVSEASTAVQETAQQVSEATQDAVQQGVTSAQETAESVAKSTKDAMNKASTQTPEVPAASSTEDHAKDLGITFTDEPTLPPAATTAPDVVPSPGDVTVETKPATSMPTSSWLDQVKEGLHQGFTTVSQKTMEGYEAAKDMMGDGPSSSDGPSWTQSLKDGFNQGVTTVSAKTSQGYEAAKEYMTSSSASVARASPQIEPSTTSTTSWTDQFQSSFTMCLSTVQEKTQQGYEATMEFVVGKHETPSSIEVEGQHAASSASTAISKGLEGAKSAMQQGVESAQAAMKPKSAKVGGA